MLLPLSSSMYDGEVAYNAGGGGCGGGGSRGRWQPWTMKMAFNGGGGEGPSMAVAAFDGSVDGLQIGYVEAKMAIDTIGGGW